MQLDLLCVERRLAVFAVEEITSHVCPGTYEREHSRVSQSPTPRNPSR
jgi:hypothetical protein